MTVDALMQYAVFCRWAWVGPAAGDPPDHRLWRLIETRLFPETAFDGESRDVVKDWMATPSGTEDDPDYERSPGRLVTRWLPDEGVTLLDFEPPERGPAWLFGRFNTEVIKRSWVGLLADGSAVYFATARAAMAALLARLIPTPEDK